MTLPVIMQTTSRSIENNIVQEAIFAASAELMGATTFYWDLNSMQDANLSNFARVIDDGNCENNNSSPRNRLKTGHIAQPLHRRCLNNPATVAADTNSTLFPNLRNSVKTNENIFVNPNPEAVGYKQSYTVSVGIDAKDINGSANPNMREITATMLGTDADGNAATLTVLRTYCANIGEVDYYKRRF